MTIFKLTKQKTVNVELRDIADGSIAIELDGIGVAFFDSKDGRLKRLSLNEWQVGVLEAKDVKISTISQTFPQKGDERKVISIDY